MTFRSFSELVMTQWSCSLERWEMVLTRMTPSWVFQALQQRGGGCDIPLLIVVLLVGFTVLHVKGVVLEQTSIKSKITSAFGPWLILVFSFTSSHLSLPVLHLLCLLIQGKRRGKERRLFFGEKFFKLNMSPISFMWTYQCVNISHQRFWFPSFWSRKYPSFALRNSMSNHSIMCSCTRVHTSHYFVLDHLRHQFSIHSGHAQEQNTCFWRPKKVFV